MLYFAAYLTSAYALPGILRSCETGNSAIAYFHSNAARCFVLRTNTQHSNKTIVDYTSPALCIPVTPFLSIGEAMRPVVNMSEKDRATDIATCMHKNLVKITSVIPEISSRTDRHTDRHTHHNYHLSLGHS